MVTCCIVGVHCVGHGEELNALLHALKMVRAHPRVESAGRPSWGGISTSGTHAGYIEITYHWQLDIEPVLDAFVLTYLLAQGEYDG